MGDAARPVSADVKPEMVTSSSPNADFSGLVDEQLEAGDPPAGEPSTGWKVASQHNKSFPFQAVIDLGAETPLATLWFYDMNNSGDVLIHAGCTPGLLQVTRCTPSMLTARWSR